MKKRQHFTVYWNERDEGEIMKHLESIARFEKRSKSSTMLVALRQYVAQYLKVPDEAGIVGLAPLVPPLSRSKNDQKPSQ